MTAAENLPKSIKALYALKAQTTDPAEHDRISLAIGRAKIAQQDARDALRDTHTAIGRENDRTERCARYYDRKVER